MRPARRPAPIRRHPDVAVAEARSRYLCSYRSCSVACWPAPVALVQAGRHASSIACARWNPRKVERQIEALLAREPGVRRRPIVPSTRSAALPNSITPAGDLRTLPCQLPNDEPRLAGLDGFFAGAARADLANPASQLPSQGWPRPAGPVWSDRAGTEGPATRIGMSARCPAGAIADRTKLSRLLVARRRCGAASAG